MPRALILGAGGQDGAYLARHLLSLGYEVHCGLRSNSSGPPWRLKTLGVVDKVVLHRLDVLDSPSLFDFAAAYKPDEVYNLAAQGHVGDSWLIPVWTHQVNALGALNVFKAFPQAKIFQASTADQFGDAICSPLGFDEQNVFCPVTPYGISKLAAHNYARAYRNKQFVSCGIMFNHESPLRQETFVTQKIAQGVKEWKISGRTFELWDVKSERDWGWAPEFVIAMHAMLQKGTPEDYVLSTGKSASVLDFIRHALQEDVRFENGWVETEKRRPVCRVTGNRPVSVKRYVGNSAKAGRELDWWPRWDYKQIAKEMAR